MDKIIPDLKVFLTVFFISFLVFFLDATHLLVVPKTFIFFVTNPISFGLFNTYKNVGNQFYFIFQARLSAKEDKALKEQVGSLLSENAKIRRNLAETESLLSQEKHLDPKTYDLITARPIGISRYLKIDKGLLDGIKIGEAVVFNENLIGKIILTQEKSSSVELLNDPDSKIAAFSQGLEGKAKGILLGQFGTEIILDKILHEEKIQVGDLVYTEGTEGNFPRGLILGRVSEVSEQQNQVFKSAKVTPVFNISDLDLVFIIKEP